MPSHLDCLLQLPQRRKGGGKKTRPCMTMCLAILLFGFGTRPDDNRGGEKKTATKALTLPSCAEKPRQKKGERKGDAKRRKRKGPRSSRLLCFRSSWQSVNKKRGKEGEGLRISEEIKTVHTDKIEFISGEGGRKKRERGGGKETNFNPNCPSFHPCSSVPI